MRGKQEIPRRLIGAKFCLKKITYQENFWKTLPTNQALMRSFHPSVLYVACVVLATDPFLWSQNVVFSLCLI